MAFIDEVKRAMERVGSRARAGGLTSKARTGRREEWWREPVGRGGDRGGGRGGGRGDRAPTSMGVGAAGVPEFTLAGVSPWGVSGGVEAGPGRPWQVEPAPTATDVRRRVDLGMVTPGGRLPAEGVTRGRETPTPALPLLGGGGNLLPGIVSGGLGVARAGGRLLEAAREPGAALERVKGRMREGLETLGTATRVVDTGIKAGVEEALGTVHPALPGVIKAGPAGWVGGAKEGTKQDWSKVVTGIGQTGTGERVGKALEEAGPASERVKRDALPAALARLERGARFLWSGGKPEYERPLGTLPALLDASAWTDAYTKMQTAGVGESKEIVQQAIGEMLGDVGTMPAAVWHGLKNVPGLEGVTSYLEKRGRQGLTILQIPVWSVEEAVGTAWQRLPGGQGLLPLTNPEKHLSPEGREQLDQLVDSWWDDYYVGEYEKWFGTTPPDALNSETARGVRRYLLAQGLLLAERKGKAGIRDYAFSTYGDRDPREVGQNLRRLAVGMGYSSYEAQVKGLNRLMAGEDLETVVGGMSIKDTLNPTPEEKTANDVYIRGIRMREGEDAANAAQLAVKENGFIPGESDVANQFLFETGLDPLNVMDVFDWVKAPAKARQAKAAARFVTRADDVSDGVKVALKNADEVGAVLAKGDEVGGLRKVWDKVNPLALTDRAKAERMAGTAYQVLTPGMFQVENADEARALVKAMGTEEGAELLTDVMGKVPVSRAADEVRPLIQSLDVDDFKSLKGATFDRNTFARELDQALIRNALDLTGAGAKEPNRYEKFVSGYRDFMSHFYLRTPGYAVRNAAGDTVTMAWDGLLSFDGRGKIDDFFKRFGPTTRRVGGAAGGSQTLLEGGKKKGAMRVAEALTGGKKWGDWIQQGEESRYTRAFYTALTRRELPDVWKPDVVKAALPADLAAALSPRQADDLARGISKGLNPEEFRGVVKKIAGGEDVIDVGRWVENPDALSVGMRLKLEGDLAGVTDVAGVDGIIDAAKTQVAEDVGKALAKDPTPPGRRVWSDFEVAQDLMEEEGIAAEMGRKWGLSADEIAQAQEEFVQTLVPGERAIRQAEVDLSASMAGVDVKDAGFVVQSVGADTTRMKESTRAAVDALRADVRRRIAEGENASVLWPQYKLQRAQMWQQNQQAILTRLDDANDQFRRLEAGEDLTSVLGRDPEEVTERSLAMLRDQYQSLMTRKKRVARLGLEEFEDFDTKLDAQRLGVDISRMEAWRMWKMNPTRDGSDILKGVQELVDRKARAAAAEADMAFAFAQMGKGTWQEASEIADKMWRTYFTDAPHVWDLAKNQLVSLMDDTAAQGRMLRHLGWSDEAAAGLTSEQVRGILAQGVRWDPLLDAPEIPMDEILQGTLTDVAGRAGLDLTMAGDWDAEDWRAVADAAEMLGKEAGDRASTAGRLWAARAKMAGEALEAAEEAPKTVARGMDLAYPQSLDDVARSMGISPAGVQKMTPEQWGEVADYCQGRGQAALLLGDPYGRQSLAAQEALRLPEAGRLGGQDVTVRVGRMSGREEVARVAEFGRQSKGEAGSVLDWVLAEAGFTPDEVGRLNFQQKKKLAAELAEGSITKTAGGRPSRIGQLDPQRRHAVLHGLSDEIKLAAGGVAADPEMAVGYRWLELEAEARELAGGAPRRWPVQAPGMYDAAGFPVRRMKAGKGRRVAPVKEAVDRMEALVPEAARLGRGQATVGFEARQAFLAERYADLRDMARARSALLDDGARMGMDVLDVPEGVVKAATRKEGDIYLLDLIDEEGKVQRSLWFEKWPDAKKAKVEAEEVIKAGRQGQAVEVGTSWSLWGAEEIGKADARAAALGGGFEPPTMADVSLFVEQEQLEALEQVREGMRGWIAGEGSRGVGSKGVAPGVRRKLLDWVDGDLSKAWTEARTVAVDSARAAADYSLLDYAGGRRRMDDWVNMVFPYTFWRTRSARNWALRFASHPARLNAWNRYQEAMEKVQRESGRRGRFAGKVRLPMPEGVEDWMGEGVYFNPSIVMPWAQALGTGWTPDEEPTGPVDRMYRVAQSFGLRPYGFIEWGLKYFDLIGKGQEDIGYWLPQTGAIQGLMAMANRAAGGKGWGGPMGVNVEEGLRKGLGIPEREPWTGYRVSRMLGNMAGDDPSLTDNALMAQELVRLVEAGELGWEEAFGAAGEGAGIVGAETAPLQGNIARLAEANGWTPEQVVEAQALLREAANRAAVERGLGSVGSFFLGAGPSIEPTGEARQLELEREKRGTMYSPLTGEGSREAYLAWREAHPEEMVRRMARSAIPGEAGEYEGMTPAEALSWRERSRQRDVINAQYDAQVQTLLAREPWNKEGRQALEDRRRAELDALSGGMEEGEVYVPSTYGANPREAAQIRQDAVLGAVSAAVPKVEEFADATGEIDWEAYGEAVDAFYEDIEGSMANDPQLAAIAEEFSGPMDRAGAAGAGGRPGLPALPVGEERVFTPQGLLEGITREDVADYWRRNDTELEALSRVWEERIFKPRWDAYYTAVDKGMDKGEAFDKFIESSTEMQAEEMIDAVMAAYPGRWTREELEEAYKGVEFPNVQEVSRLRKPEEERALSDASDAFWTYYNEQLPPGYRMEGARDYHLVQAILDAEARGTVTTEQYERALEWLNQWRADNYAEDWREEDWAEARELNEKLKDQVEQRWPDIQELQDQYFELDKTERKLFLQEHPELKEYWDFREAWGEQYPVWGYFYLRGEGMGGGGGGYGGRRYYRRGGYGGGRGWGGYDEFAYAARRVPRWGLYAPKPWETAVRTKPYRARGVPWILGKWKPGR